MLSISKILFTAVVIGLVVLLLRVRGRSQTRSNDPVVTRQQDEIGVSWFPRVAAYTIIAIGVLTSGLFAFYEWRDAYRVVNVRVVNTHTGNSVTYRAHRGDVDGRRFETLDGRVITLAEVERMELGGRE